MKNFLVVSIAVSGLLFCISTSTAETLEEYQTEVINSYHGQLGKDTGLGMLEKWCSLPNFRYDLQGVETWNVKCGFCHVGGGFDTEGEPLNINCNRCHEEVEGEIGNAGPVTIASCALTCHAKDKAKRGDIFDADHDVHISAGMGCQYCHESEKHNLLKGDAIDTTEETYVNTMNQCQDCHGESPHNIRGKGETYNKHANKIACETCHTGVRPAGIALAYRTWATFNEDGTPVTTKRMETWIPELKWHKSGSGDGGHLPILGFTDQRTVPGSKITPFNAVTVDWFNTGENVALDDTILVSEVKAADANGDRTTTVEEMQAYDSGSDGSDYPDAVLITEDMNFQISHNVTLVDAFTCKACHGDEAYVITDWKQLGYPKDPALRGRTQ